MKGIRVYLIIIAMLFPLVFLWKNLDCVQFFKWWLVLFGLGVIFIPITSVIFKRFAARGYIFSKIIGIAVSGYLVWALAALRILPFRPWTGYLALAACLGVNIYISRKTCIFENIVNDKSLLKKIVFQEAVFIFALFYWSYLKGINPDIESLEKYMDFGFMNSALRSDYFPPIDMWYAGMPINYYYLGQYYAAYLTRISFVPPWISYNLMIATLFAISFMASFTIGEHLFEIFERNSADHPLKYAKPFCGLLTGALVTLSGSMHTPIYTIFARDKNPHGTYWYPDATRYIGHNPVIEGDRTIHEFPLYSYVVSDLHAHVLNMIFVLTVIGIAIALVMDMLSDRESRQERRDNLNSYCLTFKQYWPGFFMVIFLIGLFPAVNFWDYPIYIVVSGVMYLYANLRLYEYRLKAWIVTACQVVLTGAAAYAVVFPFHMNFEAISSSIEFVTINSRFYQLVVLYGYQAFFFVTLIITAVTGYYRFNALPKKNSKNSHTKTISDAPLYARPAMAERSGFFDFIEKINPSDMLAMLLFACAIGLIIIPEIIYVKDIYGDHRANTMFKLCYQAFIMLALGVGYTFSRIFLCRGKKGVYGAAALLLSSTLLTGAFMYPFYAITGWYGSTHFSNYKGLDGTRYMLTYEEQLTKLADEIFPEGQEPQGEPESWPRVLSMADDYPIVQYINQHVKGQPVIAEANHYSYTRFGRISANTGLPNIFNWWTHELLWRNAHEAEFGGRMEDLESLYTTADADSARGVIEKYNISYIIVGKLERAKYRRGVNENLLRSLGSVVCQSNDTYLIKVNK
ncbi:MAG: DUF2298 domain-containing protein [Clostridiales bacterium]|jgi:YYY domain-containing protein|nr:DUF2298 domain-containing protein [Clostridiales bacterium]